MKNVDNVENVKKDQHPSPLNDNQIPRRGLILVMVSVDRHNAMTSQLPIRQHFTNTTKTRLCSVRTYKDYGKANPRS